MYFISYFTPRLRCISFPSWAILSSLLCNVKDKFSFQFFKLTVYRRFADIQIESIILKSISISDNCKPDRQKQESKTPKCTEDKTMMDDGRWTWNKDKDQIQRRSNHLRLQPVVIIRYNNTLHYCVSDLRQVRDFLRALWFPPPTTLTAMI